MVYCVMKSQETPLDTQGLGTQLNNTHYSSAALQMYTRTHTHTYIQFSTHTSSMANVATHKLDVLPLVQQHGELEEDEGGDDVAPHERRQDHDDHREQLLMGKEGLKDL